MVACPSTPSLHLRLYRFALLPLRHDPDRPRHRAQRYALKEETSNSAMPSETIRINQYPQADRMEVQQLKTDTARKRPFPLPVALFGLYGYAKYL